MIRPPIRGGDANQHACATGLRVAVYGLRHDHVWWVLPQLLDVQDAELVAIAGERPDLLTRAEAAAGRAVPTYTDLEEMLDHQQPDALVALTPNNEHRAVAQLCAARSIHLYTHKPMATTLDDAEAFTQAVTEAGITTFISSYPLFAPAAQLLFARLGDLGQLRTVTATAGIPGPSALGVLSDDYMQWLYDPEQHGGGSLADSATYGLVVAAWLLGRPRCVTASVHSRLPQANRGVEDESWVLLEYDDASAVVHGSWSSPIHRKPEIVITGDGGELRLWNDEVWFTGRRDADGRTETSPLRLGDDDAATRTRTGIDHFVGCVLGGRPVDTPFAPATHLLVQEIVDAAYQSAADGIKVGLRSSTMAERARST